MPSNARRTSTVRFAPAHFNGGVLSQREYEARRDIATASELKRLEASPEFEKWEAMRRERRRRPSKLLASSLALLLLCGGTFLLVQHLPPHLRLPMADTRPGSQLPVQPWYAAWQADACTAHIDRQDHQRALSELKAQHKSLMDGKQQEIDAALAQRDAAVQEHQALQKQAEESERREAQLRQDLQDAQAAAQRAQSAHSMAAQAREDGLKRKLERAEKELAGARGDSNHGPNQQPVLSASSVAMMVLALVATSALAFWHSAVSSAAAQGGEIEMLRLQAEAQEARIVEEKSMIGRLQKEVVHLNSAKMQWEDQLAAAVAQLQEQMAEQNAEMGVVQQSCEHIGATGQAANADRDQRMQALTVQVQEHAEVRARLEEELAGLRQELALQQDSDAAAKGMARKVELLQNMIEDAFRVAEHADQERRECVGDLQALLDCEIANTSALLDHAAVEKAIAEQSLAELGDRAARLEGEGGALRMQLAFAEDERSAAAADAAFAAAEAAAAERLNMLLEAEVAALDGDVAEAAAAHAGACEHVAALLMRLTQRLRYEDVEVECDRRQAQARASLRDLSPGLHDCIVASVQPPGLIQELQQLRTQLEGHVDSLAGQLRDVEAENARLLAGGALLRRQCADLDAQLRSKTAALSEAVQIKGRLSGLLEEERSAVARLQRSQGCLEGQVEQLTSSLVDATTRKGDAERRLRQYQQDLNEMEMLMGRAEEERVALEAEVCAMRCTASEAATQLLLAEEQLSRDMQRSAADSSPGLDDTQQSRPASAATYYSIGKGGAPIQTPITAALSLMQKMDGVARLLAGQDETPTHTSPGSKATASRSQQSSPVLSSTMHLEQGGTARVINFMGRAAGVLGSLGSHMAADDREEGSAEHAPDNNDALSPIRSQLASPLARLEQALARVGADVTPGAVLQAAAREQQARLDRLQRGAEHSSAEAAKDRASSASLDGTQVDAHVAAQLERLHDNMTDALRGSMVAHAALLGAARHARAAADGASRADGAHARAQARSLIVIAALEALVEGRCAAEERVSGASAAVAAADGHLSAAAARKAAADAALREFETKGLGAFGGSGGGSSNESAVVWRERVDAQDAFSAAAQAKSDALQAKEDAMLAKKALLARLEAAVHALRNSEAAADEAAAAAGQAAAELDAQVQAVIETQAAFEAARSALGQALSSASEAEGREQSLPIAAGGKAPAGERPAEGKAGLGIALVVTSMTASPPGVGLGFAAGPDDTTSAAASKEVTPQKTGSTGSAASQSVGSPGSVENQPQRANQNQAGRGESLVGLPGTLLRAFQGGVFKAAPAAPVLGASSLGANKGETPGGGNAVPRHSSVDERAGKGRAPARRSGGRRVMNAAGGDEPNVAERSLALMDDGWSGGGFLH